eukprot:CAMPEP_0206489142 /NCGR_PEP_ID=MMETSP0324_2-20121206/42981_1 /ASSEMBLY_ACC=CAM_ASM_000836 /TAXON_ID=2866 /ORGANISM="Crypthecodinium cohnii, Strain Seligo" /LENGTH=51 /DNA_ID=CAMNT_0053968599 /DNA_START=169 /DNA_END=321 /DNA_ORIENTATION=-
MTTLADGQAAGGEQGPKTSGNGACCRRQLDSSANQADGRKPPLPSSDVVML